MGSDGPVLGFDTSAAHCAAALLSDGQILAARSEEMRRGQAERLIPLLEEVLAEGGAGWRDLRRIGVGVGPGNFTGIRIAVSAARGLALALGVPGVGVSTFAATSHGRADPHLPVVPGPRGQLYVCAADAEPSLMSEDRARSLGLVLAFPPPPREIAIRIARHASDGEAGTDAPAPVYVRAADAAPPREAPPVILEDDN
ncbi:tRNA (adenosine(37)-N6)-threonylcarbamoyltransferase complex dimerization subunit type 1 TsaB [Roseovarius salis]|uniref:tRNA (adenosine(37)-N6)-threonylcarbamoyltransferase complex dimerization subunit type 1 TsaB n=1 Tax=Roseovarius salis TaxID=3376063 RepID=UPI0037C88C02